MRHRGTLVVAVAVLAELLAVVPAGASGVTSVPAARKSLGAIDSGPATPRVGPRVPKESWTASSHTKELPDGRVRVDLFTSPRFRSVAKGWRPVDPTVRRADGARSPLVAPDYLVPLRFGAGGGSALELGLPKGPVDLEPKGLKLGVPERDGKWIVYRNVAPSTDLRYSISDSGIKEELVLRGPSAPTEFSFRLADPKGQLGKVEKTKAGAYRFGWQPEKGVAMEMPPATAYELGKDGNGPRPTEFSNNSARLVVKSAVGGFDLRLSLDKKWAKGKRYPIALDPTISFNSDSASNTNGYIRSDNGGNYSVASTDNYLFAGTNDHAVRSVLKFDLTQIPWKSRIDDATFQLYNWACLASGPSCPATPYQVNLQKITTPWSTGSTWNAISTATDPSVLDSVTGAANQPQGWEYYDISGQAQRWVNGDDKNYGFVARVADESLGRSGPAYWSSRANNGLTPKLSLTYAPNSTHGYPAAAPGSTSALSIESAGSTYAAARSPYRALHVAPDYSNFVRANAATAGRFYSINPPYQDAGTGSSFGGGSAINTATAQDGNDIWLASGSSATVTVQRWSRTVTWTPNGSSSLITSVGLNLGDAPKGIWYDKRDGRLYVAFLANVLDGTQVVTHVLVSSSSDRGASFGAASDLGPFSWASADPAAFQFVPFGQTSVGLLSRQGSVLSWRSSVAAPSAPQVLETLSSSVSSGDNFQAVTTDDGVTHLVVSASGFGQRYRRLVAGSWLAASVLSAAHKALSLSTDGSDLWLAAGSSGSSVTLSRRSAASSTWASAPSIGAASGIPALPERIDPHSIPLLWTDATGTWLNRIDDLPPEAQLVSPASGSTLSGTVTVAATATDAGVGVKGVSRVDFFVDRGNGYLGYLGSSSSPDGSGLFSVTWNTAEPASAWSTLGGSEKLWQEGAYQVYATAYDHKGRSSQSPRADTQLKRVDVGSYEYRPTLPVAIAGVSASVNLLNGNLSVTQTDAAAPTVIGSMSMIRSYNSLDLADRKVGLGWALSSDVDLDVAYRSLINHSGDPSYPSGTVELIELDGTQAFFMADATGSTYRGFGDYESTLSKFSDGTSTTWTLSPVDGSKYTFDSSGRPTSATPPSTGATNKFVYGYDATTGLLKSVQDPAGRSLTVTFSAGRVASVKDVDTTRVWTYTYDAYNRLAVVSDPASVQTSFGYTSGNRLNEIKDGRNQSTYFDYDAQGRVYRVRRPFAGTDLTTTIDYSTAGQAVVVGPRGNQAACDATCKTFYATTHKMDAAGRVIAVQRKLPDGTVQERTIGWDEPAGLLGAKRPRNLKTSESDWQGNTTRSTYDEAGQLISSIDPLGNTTVNGYDEADAATAFTGQGLVGEFFPNKTFTPTAGFPVQRIDARLDFPWEVGAPEGGIPADGFSARWSGRLNVPATGLYTFSTLSDDGVRLTVDGRSLIDNWTDHAATVNTSPAVLLTQGAHDIFVQYYENLGDATLQLFWESPTMAKRIIGKAGFEGDVSPGVGLLSSTRDASGHTTRFGYDDAFRRLRLTETETNVDASGITTVVKTRYDYTDPATGDPDVFGRLRKKTLPEGTLWSNDDSRYSTVYSYAGLNEMATDPCTGASVSQAGLLKTKTFGIGGGITTEGTVYDVRGNPVVSTDGKGSTVTCYDARNRRISVKAPDRTTATTYTYDNNDNRLTVADPVAGQSIYAYDSLDRLSSATDVFNKQTTYSYNDFLSATQASTTKTNAAGTTTTVADQQGRTVAETFTPTGGAASSYSFTYDAQDRLIGTTLPNGFSTTRTYDLLGRPSTLRHLDAGGSLAAEYGVCETPMPSCPISYDANSRKVREDGPAGSWRYGYDSVGRLERVHDPRGYVRRYRFDRNTNRTALETSAGHDWSRVTGTLPSGVGTPVVFTDQDNGSTQVSLPFPVSFYGQSVSNLWVSPNGFASLASVTAARPPLETTAGFFPFAADFKVGTGSVVTTSDDALNPTWFLVRWKVQNVNASAANASDYHEFGLQLFSNGKVRFLYGTPPPPLASSSSSSSSASSQEAGEVGQGGGSSLPAQVGYSGGSEWDFATVGGLHGSRSALGADGVEVAAHAATSATFSYNERDQLQGRTYDQAGNTVAAAGQSFAYDGRSLITQVSSGGVTSSLSYDGEGRQVTAVSGGVTRRVHYGARGDSGASFETNNSGQVTARTVVGPGGLLAAQDATGTRFVLADPKGSVAATVDQMGTITTAPLVDEYGVSTPNSSPYGYLGGYQKQTDPTGIMVMGARGYDPNIGRFLQRDPVEGGSANDYDYVNADPINNLDLDGTLCWRPTGRKRCHMKDAVKSFRGGYKKGSQARVVADAAVKCLDNKSRTPNSCFYAFLKGIHAFVSGPFDPVWQAAVKATGRLGGYFGCGNIITCSARTLTSTGLWFGDNGNGMWVGVGGSQPFYIPSK